MTIDDQGQIAKLTGIPDEVASDLRRRRVAVVANCKPTEWGLSYRAKVY